MKTIKYILITVVVLSLAWLVIFGIKMDDGRDGPIGIPHYGLTSSSKSCIGFITKRLIPDATIISCHGLVIGPEKCFGVPYTAPTFWNAEEVQLDCNYPCSDSEIKDICKKDDNGLYGECSSIMNQCNW